MDAPTIAPSLSIASTAPTRSPGSTPRSNLAVAFLQAEAVKRVVAPANPTGRPLRPRLLIAQATFAVANTEVFMVPPRFPGSMNRTVPFPKHGLRPPSKSRENRVRAPSRRPDGLAVIVDPERPSNLSPGSAGEFPDLARGLVPRSLLQNRDTAARCRRRPPCRGMPRPWCYSPQSRRFPHIAHPVPCGVSTARA
jgi:hypothetical protein